MTFPPASIVVVVPRSRAPILVRLDPDQLFANCFGACLLGNGIFGDRPCGASGETFMKRIAALVLALMASVAHTQHTISPPGARVSFINLKRYQHVTSPFLVQFAVTNMGIAPAGYEAEGTGHHHLFIDTDPPVGSGPIPMDERHRHYFSGEPEAIVSLPTGPHTLQLVFADSRHYLHEPPIVSDRISIFVDQ
jgi:hypothetical protein